MMQDWFLKKNLFLLKLFFLSDLAFLGKTTIQSTSSCSVVAGHVRIED